MLTCSAQVVGLSAVRGRQERQELVAAKWGRFDGLLVIALEEADGEWSSLLASLLARNGVDDGEGDARLCRTLPPLCITFNLRAGAHISRTRWESGHACYTLYNQTLLRG